MKRSTKLFFSSFYLSSVIIACIILAFFGISRSYENMVYKSFGVKKSAVEIIDGGIRILDFEIRY